MLMSSRSEQVFQELRASAAARLERHRQLEQEHRQLARDAEIEVRTLDNLQAALTGVAHEPSIVPPGEQPDASNENPGAKVRFGRTVVDGPQLRPLIRRFMVTHAEYSPSEVVAAVQQQRPGTNSASVRADLGYLAKNHGLAERLENGRYRTIVPLEID